MRIFVIAVLAALIAVIMPGAAVAAKPKPRPLNVLTWGMRPPVLTTIGGARFSWKVKPVTAVVQCQLDTGRWATCKERKKVFSKLADGSHTFRIRVRKRGTTGPFFARSWSWRIDRAAPIGGSLSYAGGTTAAASTTVSFAGGTDGAAGSGIATVTLERSLAPFVDNGCGAFGAFSAVTGAVSSPFALALIDGTCAQLRVTVTDLVGNSAAVTSSQVVRSEQSDLVVSGPSSASTEGGTSGSFTVSLTAQPTAPVVVTAVAGAGVTPTPTARTFTPTNWHTPQTFPMVAVDNAIAEAASRIVAVTFTAASADLNWHGESGAGIITVIDNDTAGINVTAPANPLMLAEAGASATIGLVLTSQPLAPVTISFTTGTQLSSSVPSITFTAANWNVVQHVAITAVDDDVDEVSLHAGTVSFSVASADPGYGGRAIPSISALIADNDTAGVSVTGGNALPIDVPEASSVVLGVVLQSRPTSAVTITPIFNVEGRVSAPPITFTAANWATPQSLTITAVDDRFANGDVTVRVTLGIGSSDPNYVSPTRLTAPYQDIRVQDDDVVSITITPVGVPDVRPAAFAIREVAAPALDHVDFDVTLGSTPVADLNIHMVSDGGDLSPHDLGNFATTVQFTPGGTLTRRFRVWAPSGDGAEPDPELDQITFTIDSSGDPGLDYDAAYAALTLDPILFSIADAET